MTGLRNTGNSPLTEPLEVVLVRCDGCRWIQPIDTTRPEIGCGECGCETATYIEADQ